jgi:DUF4097 and DUF4098 domain-containing protein YvlB
MGQSSKQLMRAAVVLCVISLAAPLTAAADFRMEKSLQFEPGAVFRLDTDSGSVSVKSGSQDTAEVVITSTRDDIEERFDFDFDDSGSGASIKVEREGGLMRRWFNNSNNNLHFEIRLPMQAEVFIDTSGGRIELEQIEGEVDLRTSGGRVTVKSVEGDVLADTSGGSIKIDSIRGSVSADTSGGAITIENVTGSAEADTSGGRITIRDVGGDILADTSGGGIDIEGAGGQVNADTSGGPVRVSFVAGNDHGGVLSSSGGRVTAVIDAGVGLDIDASTSGGSLHFDLPLSVRGTMSKSQVRGTLNGGGATLKMRSSGGGIYIETN